MKLYIKYMVSTRCKMAVKEALKKLGLHFIVVDLGEVELMETLSAQQTSQLKKALLESGLEMMDDKRAVLIEKIQNVITQMIHHSDESPKVNYSQFISEKLNYDYTYLSNLFSEVKGITIQQFIIIHKIERVKELLCYEELSLTEISYKLHYSSVAHLSNQFKKVTGLSPTDYKQLKEKRGALLKKLENPMARMNNHDLKDIKTLETSMRQESQYARSLIEASLDPLVTISGTGKIMDMNAALASVTGMSREELTGTDFLDYFTEPQRAREVYQEVFARGSVADSPLTLRHKNGKLTDVLFNGSVFRNNVGEVSGVVIVARDVTEQKRIERELTEAKVFAELATGIAEEAKSKADGARAIAEDAVKAKQQFLSNMSHEIRTPMNAIIGFTKVVLKTDLTEKQKEYLTAIKVSGDALIVLINDILDLAKVDAGKMTFEQTPFKLALSISAMLHLFEPKIQEKNLTLVKEYDHRIPEVMVGDPVRLHQIILNLISNAVKFTNQGKIIVNVVLLTEDDRKAVIEFSVTDTGIGIAPDKVEHVFENFQQATSGTSRLYGGTGLGLAIVKKLVESQDGSIHVKSVINKGSTFSFILTFQKTSSDAALESAIVETDAMIKGVNILVVEDIALNQLLMKTLLNDFGVTCDIAENGKIAIDLLKANRYDLVLMDLQMPEMNGFEATEHIRKEMKSAIPIIALTADVTTVDLAKCKDVGMNDYLAKPLDERLLYAKIIGFLQKPPKPRDIATPAPLPSEQCINLDYLKQRTKSDANLMGEMITLYLGQTEILVATMKLSAANKDWQLLQSTVHKMIPSFSIVGIDTKFEDMAKDLQRLVADRSEMERVPALVLQLSRILEQSCIELKEELKTLNAACV